MPRKSLFKTMGKQVRAEMGRSKMREGQWSFVPIEANARGDYFEKTECKAKNRSEYHHHLPSFFARFDRLGN